VALICAIVAYLAMIWYTLSYIPYARKVSFEHCTCHYLLTSSRPSRVSSHRQFKLVHRYHVIHLPCTPRHELHRR
jgi:hypothetical protein